MAEEKKEEKTACMVDHERPDWNNRPPLGPKKDD